MDEQTQEDSLLGSVDDLCRQIDSLCQSTDPNAAQQLMTIVSDESINELVRIEVLNAISAIDFSVIIRSRFRPVVMSILSNLSDSQLVRQYAARTMRFFMDDQEAVELVVSRVLDSAEDIDVRHNSLTALETNARRPSCESGLRRLMLIPEFEASIKRTLNRQKSDR